MVLHGIFRPELGYIKDQTLWFGPGAAKRSTLQRLPGEELGLRGVGGGGLDGLGGRRGLAGPDDTEGEPDLRPLGEDLCSVPSTAGELSLLCLRGAAESKRGRDVKSRQL